MSVLVTGVAGFVGSHVAAALAADGYDVVGLDDLSGGFRDHVPTGVKFLETSLLDVAAIDRLFAEHRFRYVYHLAAYAAEGLSHFIRRFNYTNNVIGSVNLINAAVNAGSVKCFVFTSSIAVYGSAAVPMREDVAPQPEDPYGVAKYAVELDLRAAKHMFGLDSIVFRPHNVYGERQHLGDRYRNVIGIFMNRLLQDQNMPVFGDGSQTRSFTYVGDVAPTIARCVTNPAAYNRTFNIGCDASTTVSDLAVAVAKAMNKPCDIEYLPARLETHHASADHSLLHRVFGKQTPTSLEQGLARMAAWATASGPREPTVFKDIEIETNLPPSWRAAGRSS